MSINNQSGGTILANVSGGTLNVNGSGTLTNAGTLKATNGGTLHVSSNFAASNFDPAKGTLQGGGTYVVNGTAAKSTLQINAFGTTGGELHSLGSGTTLTLIGTNANTLLLDANGINALNLSSNSGNLNLESGYNLAAARGTFSNSGNVTIDSASSLTVTGGNEYLQTGGETQVDGTINANLVEIQGGALAGGNGTTSGSITGSVTNDCNTNTCGTVRAGDNLNVPVDPPGNLSIGGDYTQDSGATLIVDIAGALASQTSQVNVGGDVDLFGPDDFLTVSLLNSFVPSVSEKFLFLTYAGTLNADNFLLTDANVDPDGVFTVDYSTAGDVYLDFTPTNAAATPEPGFTYPVFGILAALLAYRKMKRNRAGKSLAS